MRGCTSQQALELTRNEAERAFLAERLVHPHRR